MYGRLAAWQQGGIGRGGVDVRLVYIPFFLASIRMLFVIIRMDRRIGFLLPLQPTLDC